MHVDRLPAPWALFDTRGHVIRINPALQRLLGSSADDPIPQRMAQILSVEALGLFETFVLPALDLHGEVREVVLSLSTLDGRIVPVQCQFQRVQPHQGIDAPAQHQVVMLQMVDRMRSQEQLRRVANAVELAPGAVFQLVQSDVHALPTCVYLSSEVQGFTGVTRMAIRSDLRALTDRIDPLHRPALWRRALRAIQWGQPLEHEFNIIIEGDQLRWLSLKARSKRYRSGRVEWFGHLSDNTEARQQREALKKSTKQLQTVVDALQVNQETLQMVLSGGDLVLWRWNLLDRTVSTGASFFSMVGQPEQSHRANLPGEELLQHVHPQDVPRYLEVLDGYFNGSRAQHDFEYRLRHADGRWLWVHSRARVVERAPDGSIRFVAGTLMEITAHREAEQQRERLETQLQQSQRMEAIGTMAGGIAHDFNNLLAAILGNVALAREDAARGGDSAESLQDIETAARTGRDLVRRMMVFSRRQPRSVSEVDLGALCRETLGFLKASLPAAARLSLSLPKVQVHTRADAVQLQQVLINLCTNAWQALPGGVGEIHISLEAEACGRWARLSVSDSGRGMDEHTVQRIFDPFFTTKEVGQGTGLGLSMVHAIIHDHGGQIEVSSELGKGSCFVVRLPASAGSQSTTPPPADATAPLRGRGLRVMYVDDNPLMMRLAQRTLERRGYVAHVFGDPAQAMAWLGQDGRRVDAVISDVNMPGMTGVQLCRLIKARWPAVPVLLTTGAISEELQSEAAQAGAHDVISKEQTFTPLLQAVQQALEPTHSGASD